MKNFLIGRLFHLRAQIGLFLLVSLVALTGCAGVAQTFSQRVYHSFSFDPSDSVGVEVLSYRYGSVKESGLHTKPEDEARGKISGGMNITGDLLVGDDLYIKWRDKATRQIYEDTVDLKSRSPVSMRGQRIKPIIEANQLYIYLISLEPVRGYFSYDEAAQIEASAITLRQKVLARAATSRIVQIYPTSVVDPQLPPTLK